jgi:hypothetical protein
MRVLIPVLVFAIATPGLAETPITAEAFEAHVTGKTVTYRQFDGVFGIEEYLPGRKVRWSTAPNECLYGSWYPEGDLICFVYEYNPAPTCWTFWLNGGALVALSSNGVAGEELYEVDASDQGLPCPGPEVGV